MLELQWAVDKGDLKLGAQLNLRQFRAKSTPTVVLVSLALEFKNVFIEKPILIKYH
jgi:hypothetical protein